MIKSKRKILITGCAGFIGSALTIKFLKNGYDVTGIDNLNDYYDKNLKLKRLSNINSISKNNLTRFDFHQISLENYKSIENIFKQYSFDVVVNLAAQAGVRYSLENPFSYFQSNLLGFGNLLEVCRKKLHKTFCLCF